MTLKPTTASRIAECLRRPELQHEIPPHHRLDIYRCPSLNQIWTSRWPFCDLNRMHTLRRASLRLCASYLSLLKPAQPSIRPLPSYQLELRAFASSQREKMPPKFKKQKIDNGAMSKSGKRVIYWFRTDLRLHDSPALKAALDLEPDVLFPIWCWDPHYVYRARVGPNRFQFLFVFSCLVDS